MTNKSWKTAIRRKAISRPMSYLHSMGLLKGRVLDFGCGHGQDVERLANLGVNIHGYDPHLQPDLPRGKFDVITCNYVLNVLPAHERLTVLAHISTLLRKGGVAYISVRRDIKADYVTAAGTQQYYVELPATVQHENRGSFIMYKVRG